MNTLNPEGQLPVNLALHSIKASPIHCAIAALFAVLLTTALQAGPSEENTAFYAPKVWDAKKLADWDLPRAHDNLRANYVSEEDYYSSPSYNTRTYPVYHSAKEPEGYWDWLHTLKPQPLVHPLSSPALRNRKSLLLGKKKPTPLPVLRLNLSEQNPVNLSERRRPRPCLLQFPGRTIAPRIGTSTGRTRPHLGMGRDSARIG